MDREGLQSFGSFEDLSKHFKVKARQKELRRVLELSNGGSALEAVKLLDAYDLSKEAGNDQLRYGMCYTKAAKLAIRQENLTASRDYLKRAINLGCGRWHVQHRLELVYRLLRGELQTEPDENWIEKYTFSCSDCDYVEPTPLVCAKCAAVLKPPIKPVYTSELSDLYSLGVYRWRGDPDSYNSLKEQRFNC